MKVEACSIAGVLRILPQVIRDDRGAFFESYQEGRYRAAGVAGDFTQDNRSVSQPGVLRGMHYQIAFPQGYLITVTRGEVFDVALDLRVGSATFGQWEAFNLTSDPPVQVFLPPGIAHGYCVVGGGADIWYRCVGGYHPNDEGGVLWNDPDLKDSMAVEGARDRATRRRFSAAAGRAGGSAAACQVGRLRSSPRRSAE